MSSRSSLLLNARRAAALLGGLAVLFAAPLASAQENAADGPTFLPDDPIAVDPDRLDMPAPQVANPSDAGDFIQNTLFSPGDYTGPARNANTMEEVPQSSWYAWRHYHDRMSLDELKRGPNPATGGGPAGGPWTVVSTKEEGKSIGMQIEDARGDRYLLKFDPPGYLALSTGAEVVVTKLFYALGYHVPQNYVVTFRLDRLELGEEVSLSRGELKELLGKVARYDDGRYRALASKFLSGEKPLGPFRYYGTRPDDGNDVFPHRSRRELRGLRVFAAWTNHVDSRSINSLDMLVKEPDPATGDTAQFVRHHLIDFGSTLGGGPLGPKDYWQGYEYAVQPGPMAVRAATLGFAGSWWLGVDYPGYPVVGHLEAAHFDPTAWKPLYPNPAFRHMDAADAFWAARQVMNFTDEEIRALVETGEYTNPDAERYLAKTMMKRRDRIGRAYLGFGGGLDRFRVEKRASGRRLVFEDLLAAYDLGPEGRERRVRWRVYNNRAGQAGRLLAETTTARTRLPLPESNAAFLVAEIETPAGGQTRAYLRRAGDGHEMVGLSRDGTTPIDVPRPASTAAAAGD